MEIELRCPHCPCRFAAPPATSSAEVLRRMTEDGPWFALARGATFEDMVCAALLTRGAIRCPDCGERVLVQEATLGELMTLAGGSWSGGHSGDPEDSGSWPFQRAPRPR